MLRPLRFIEARILPRGWFDVVRQFTLFFVAFTLYGMVRTIVYGNAYQPGYKPFGDATKIINLERLLHVFVEPSIQTWTESVHWLMDFADWTYLNAHFFVTVGALIFIYSRRNDSFNFVRNALMIAMAIALVGYTVYPTAPPRLMPEWGFTDSIKQFTGIQVESGPGSAVLNLYAAVPSMHVCFALLIGVPMARLVRHRWVKALWLLYPLLISFVVMATGNHYLFDVLLGAVTAGIAGLLARRSAARARPEAWAFNQASA